MSTSGHKLFILGAILALCCVSVSEQHSVVIVGAGASGLGAATRLLANGLNDVTVLEAEDRIGGRVNSVPFGDAIVELGAEWCHGQEGNVVHEMVKDLDMLEAMENSMDIVFSDGKMMGRNYSEELMKIFMDVAYNPDKTADANKTSGEAFEPAFIADVNKKFHDDPEVLALALKTMPLMESFMLSVDSSFTWHDSSAVTGYEDCPGNPSLTWKGKGFKQIFDVMAMKVPESAGPALPLEDKIHFNKIVSKINYSGDKPVVTCSDGTEYTADSVIFTASLGVLKHDHEEFFEPALPEDKVKAIEDLGIDAVMKIILHYPEAWWPKNLVFGYNFVFTEEDNKEIIGLFTDGPTKDGKSWVSSIITMMPAEHNPNVAYTWLAGPLIPEIEKMTDEDIQKGMNYVHTKYLGHVHNITKPDKILRSTWYTNPHFRGSYSYETLKSRREGECAHMILARPVKNTEDKEVLFFAGEATHMTHYSTVHGAIETGYREADRILKTHHKPE